MLNWRKDNSILYVGGFLLLSLGVLLGCSAKFEQGASKNHEGFIQTHKFSEAAIQKGYQGSLEPKSQKYQSYFLANSEKHSPNLARDPGMTSTHSDSLSSLDSLLHSRMAWSFVLEGNYPAAEAAYRAVLRQDATHAEAYLGLGMALRMQGAYEQAFFNFSRALEIQPGYSAALVHLGYAYIDGLTGKQNYQKAKDLFQQASNKGDLFAKLALVDLNRRRGNS